MTDIDTSLAIAGQGTIHLITPANVYTPDDDDQIVSASLATDITKYWRADSAVIVGRYVQATIPNLNNNEFSLPDLLDRHNTITDAPLNIMHRKDKIVGHYVATEMKYPTNAGPDNLGAPWVDAASLFYIRNNPDVWAEVLRAGQQGLLWYSMEAVGQTITCTVPGHCGQSFPYRGVSDASYCEPLRKPGGNLRIDRPYFVGGALVLPPGRPGWPLANIQTVAATVARHEAEAEMIYRAFAARATELTPREWEEMMAQTVAACFADEPVPTKTATQMPEQPAPTAVNFAPAMAAAGVMICVPLPDQVIAQLAALPGVDESPDQMHITIAFLGQANDTGPNPDAPILTLPGPDGPIPASRVERVVAAVSAATEPIDATITGIGRWAQGTSGNVECVVALVDSPGLTDLYSFLTDRLADYDIPVSRNHGFIPHITLHYGSPGSGPATLPTIRFKITELDIWWAGYRRPTYPLGPAAAVKHWGLPQDLVGPQ